MPASYILKEVRRIALSSRRNIEKAGNMMTMSSKIMFAMKKEMKTGNAGISAWVYYDPNRDWKGRTAFYSSLKERIDNLSSRIVRKW